MRKYSGIQVKQRANSDITFIVMAVQAKQVYQWAQADDIRLDKGNVQRELIDSRWRQVKKFFLADARNIVPTSVTVAFDEETIHRVDTAADLDGNPNAYFINELGDGLDSFVEIWFEDSVRENAYIIDGQHRLKGMSELEEDLLVPVCLFPSLSRLERAFQFVTINNKSHKVPTDNLKALIRNFDTIELSLRDRLAQASITARGFATHVDVMNEDAEGPFFKIVNWVNNRHADGKKIIVPAAIENAITAIHKGFPETKNDPADAIIVLSSIWRAIFEHYHVTLANVEQFKNLTKKPVIQRLTEMVVDHLVRTLDPVFSIGGVTKNNAHAAREVAIKMVTNVPAEFWTDNWKLKGLDTGAGRDLITRGIRHIKQKQEEIEADANSDWRVSNPLYMAVDEDAQDEDE